MTNAGLHAACARSVHARQRGSASSCAYQGPGTQTSSPPPLQCRPRCAPSCSSDPAWAPRGPRWGRPGTGPCAPRPPAWCNPHSSRWPAWASRNLFKSGARASACKSSTSAWKGQASAARERKWTRAPASSVVGGRARRCNGETSARRAARTQQARAPTRVAEQARACLDVQWRGVRPPRRANATVQSWRAGKRVQGQYKGVKGPGVSVSGHGKRPGWVPIVELKKNLFKTR